MENAKIIYVNENLEAKTASMIQQRVEDNK
jgi:hypothetical protein